ncbi:hypothetical protein RQ734_15240, partial [Roseomonas mucosa]|uniref:hypothetical protein n=1 Tax=Roseomonas mucosa TaxID=207340 RepID=UPI0028CE81AB
MATVAFDYKGASYEVDVDDSFFEKSPEQQQAAILGRIGGGSKPSAPAAPDTSLRSAIEYGRANVEAGGQATNRVLGLGNPDAKPAEGPANYDPASPKVIEGVREGDVGKALGYLPRAAVENAPDLAGGMAAGAVGAGIGGVFGSVVPGAGTAAGMWLGGLAGSGLYSLYRSFGQNVEGRAENNGHVDEKGRAQPTTGDYVAGGLTSAATSALDAVGARGLGRAAGKAMSATGRLGDVPLSALGRARQAGTAVAREGGTETVQSLVEQTGQTLGTEKGLSVDPAQALGEGLIGLGSGAGVKAAHGAVDAAGATVGAAKDGAVALARRPLEKAAAEALNAGDVEQAKSIVRVTDAAQRWAENTTGREATLDEHMNGMREEITKSLQNTLHLAEREQGWVTEEQARKLRGVLETAARHNKSLAVGEAPADLDTDPHSRPAYGLQLVQEMNAPDSVKQQLADGLRDLDNLAFGARKKNLRGPLESLFGNLGGAAAIGAAGYFGGPTAAIGTGLALGAGAQPVARKLGEKIGRRIDRAAGISEPTLQLARRQALKTLGDQSPGEDTLVSLARLQEQLTDPSLEVPKTADQIRESQHFLNLAKRRWDSNLPIDESLPSRLTPEHRQALFDWLTEKQDKILASVGEGNAADLAQNRRELESAEARKQRELDQMAAQAQGPDRRTLSPEQAFEAAE